MSSYACPEGCGREYGSIKAAMLCQCDQLDKYGYEMPARGIDWLP